MTSHPIVKLNEGMAILMKGVRKLERILEGLEQQQFTSEEYINTYTYTSSLAAFLSIFTLYFLFPQSLIKKKIPFKFILSFLYLIWMSNLFLTMKITGVSITCAPRNLLMIILNSYTTNTRTCSKNTLNLRWVNVVTIVCPYYTQTDIKFVLVSLCGLYQLFIFIIIKHKT